MTGTITEKQANAHLKLLLLWNSCAICGPANTVAINGVEFRPNMIIRFLSDVVSARKMLMT